MKDEPNWNAVGNVAVAVAVAENLRPDDEAVIEETGRSF